MSERAVVYARVSTAQQGTEDKTSLEYQVARCREAAEKRGWEVAEEYVDTFTGTTDARPELQRLLADARSGEFQAVVVLKWDRVARNARVGLGLAADLEDAGAALLVVDADFDTSTAAGKLMRHMLMGFAEFDRDMIVERTTRGQRGKAARGAWPGGTAPYGYRLVGKGATCEAEHDPQERDTLLKAIAWIVDEGLTTGEVCQRLNALGRTPRHAPAWEHRNLRRTLTSEKLLGRVVWGQQTSRRGDHKTRLLPDGKPKYGAPVALQIEPLVTEERFAALQKALADKGGWTRRPDGVYPLSGRLVSPCGDTYGGVYRRDRVLRQYRCRRAKWNATGHERCGDVRLDADHVERLVWAEVCELLGDPARLEALAQEWLDRQATVDGPDPADLEQRIADRQRALTSTVTEYAKAGLPPEAVKAATVTIQEELDALLTLQAQTESNVDDGVRLTELASLAEAARDRLGSMTLAEQKQVLALLDVRVTVLENVGRPSVRVEGRVWTELLGDLAAGELAAGASRSRTCCRRWPPVTRAA